MENRKPFLTCNYGTNSNGVPFAFHVEGNVGREPFFKAGEGEKKSVINFSMGIGRSAWVLLGKDGPENPWVTVVGFGPVAETLHAAGLCQGAKVVVSGRVAEEAYTKEDGTSGSNVRIYADNAYILANRVHEGGEPNKTVARATRVYESHGERHQESLACLLGGKIVSVTPVNEVNGQPTISFDIELPIAGRKMEAIVSGKYNKDENYGDYTKVRCSVWGQRAQRLGRVLALGNVVVVTGAPYTREWNGQTYVNLSIRDISVMKWATPAATGNASAATNNASAKDNKAATPSPANNNNTRQDNPGYETDFNASNFASFMDDDDLDLPF